MNDKTGGRRGPRRAAALAVMAAVAVLATGCGMVHVHAGSSGGSAPTGSAAAYRADLAYAQCMRTHGVPGFPNPHPSGRISIGISGQPHGNSPAARANDACEHLLAAGSTGTGSAAAPQATASPSATLTTSRAVIRYQPGQPAALAGSLPVPVANAGAAVVGGTAFLVGGDDGKRPVPTVTEFRLVSLAAAIPSLSPGSPVDARSARTPGVGEGGGSGSGSGSGTGSGPGDLALASAPWLSPPRGRGHLAPHSDPAALPADVLIADNHNNRLLVIDPQGRIRWQFPQPGDLARGQTFTVPDDAFFSPNGKDIIATEEDDSVISVINIATHRISYRYGTPGVPGSGPNHVSNPDDAMLLPGGEILSADIKNCRIILVRPPAHWPARIIGQAGSACWHDPPRRFGSPNGAFPMTNGKYLVTEINGSWVNAVSLSGHVSWSINPPDLQQRFAELNKRMQLVRSFL